MNDTTPATTAAALPWHREQWGLVDNWRRQDRLPHAILLKGRAGLGKAGFAAALAQALLCRDAAQHALACGRCDSCRLYAAGSHPDFHALQPEPDKSVIGIDQVRELCRQMALTSQHGTIKIAMITPADAMSRGAANSLLKTLEEPPGDSLLILVSSASAQLPATIRSRCQSIAFRSDRDRTSLQWLSAQLPPQADPALLLDLADGAPMLARDLYADDSLQARTAIVEGIEALAGAAANPCAIADDWHKLGMPAVVYWLWMLLEDTLRLKLGADRQRPRNRDLLPLLQRLAERLDYQVLFQMLDWCLDTRRVLQGNINLVHLLMLEELTITWRNASRHGN